MAVDQTYINLRNWAPVTIATTNSGVHTFSFNGIDPAAWPEAVPARFSATLEFHWCHTCTSNTDYTSAGIVHCRMFREPSGNMNILAQTAGDLGPVVGSVASLAVSDSTTFFRLAATMESVDAVGFLTVVPMLRFVQVAS
jgi:hypothetical protein